MGLPFRDRLSLIRLALTGAGVADIDPASLGGRLLHGIIPAGGSPPERNVSQYLQAFSRMPWLRAAVSRIAISVGEVDWQVFVPMRNGRPQRNLQIERAARPIRKQMIARATKEGELRQITESPVLDLLHDANPMHVGVAVRRLLQAYLELSGEAFWLLERDERIRSADGRGIPVRAWPMPPNWVRQRATPAFPFFRVSIRGFQDDIPASDMIWFCDPNPADPYGAGIGTAQSLADELDTDEAAAKHAKMRFFNRARPDLLVYPKDGESLQAADIDRLERHWLQRNRGFFRAGLPYFLRRAVEIKELSQNLRNDQFIQLREFERDTCLQVFGVPPEVLGIVSNSNRATALVAEKTFTDHVLIPRLELLRAIFQERLLPLFDEGLIIDFVNPSARDIEMELEAAKAAPWAPNVDEWREMSGLPPLENDRGKVHGIPLTLDFREIMAAECPENSDDGEPPGDGESAASREGEKGLFTPLPDEHPQHDGLLASVWLDEHTAKAIAIPGGEPPEDLHITLGFCGKADDLGDSAIARAVIAVGDVCKACGPLRGQIGGAGRFRGSPLDKDVVYAVPDVPGLAELRHHVAEALREAGCPPLADHGWSPHITLAFVASGGVSVPSVPSVDLEIQEVTLSVGDRRTTFALSRRPDDDNGVSVLALRDASDDWESWVRETRDLAKDVSRVGDVNLDVDLQKTLADDIDQLPPLSQLGVSFERRGMVELTRIWREAEAVVDEGAIVEGLERRDMGRVMDALHHGLWMATQTRGIQRVLEPAYRLGADHGVNELQRVGVNIERTQKQVAVSFDAINQEAVRYARSQGCRLVAPSRGTTGMRADALIRRLRDLVTLSQREGIEVRTLAQMIRGAGLSLTNQQQDAVLRFSARLQGEGVSGSTLRRRLGRFIEAQRRARAFTIARTETIDALNAGQDALWRQAVRQGVLSERRMERVWIVTLDDVLDTKICEPLSDATAKLDEPFQPGGFMRPPAHPRCRCAVGLKSA